MVPINIQSIKGTDGQVRMPNAGILVGWFSSWTMTKESGETYTFRGTFGHVNTLLWKKAEADGDRRITLKLSREKTYDLCWPDDAKIEYADNQLRIEGAHLCQAPEDSKQ